MKDESVMPAGDGVNSGGTDGNAGGGSAGLPDDGTGGTGGGDSGDGGTDGANDGGGPAYDGSDTLLVYFPFDSMLGEQAEDASGNNHHGTLQSNAGNPIAQWVSGKFEQAIEFSGQNYVRVPYQPAWNTINANDAFTVAGWTFQTDHQTGWSMVASRQYNTTGREHWALAFRDGNAAALVDASSLQGQFCTDTGLAPLNQWAHLAATYDGSMLRAYLNGTQVCAVPVDMPLAEDDTSTDIVIGGNSNDASTFVGEPFVGKLDEVVLYARVLDENEIAALVAGDPPPTD